MADEGEVSVDVVADTTAFETRLRAKLEELAKKLQAKIKLVVDDVAARATLKSFQATAARAKVGLKATLSTALASIELDEWARKAALKTVEISVKISKKSLAIATGQLQSLTGLNAIGSTISKFSGEFTSFFDNLPTAGVTLVKFASKAALAGNVLGSLAVTLNLLASAGPGLVASLVAAPGILAGVAVQAAVLVVALKNAPPAVKQALAGYRGLQKIISNNFWAGASKNASDFFTGIKGQVLDGFKVVSTASGSFFGSFAKALSSTLGGGVLTQMFSNIQKSISNFGGAADPLAGVLANLGLFGTSLLPAISAWLVKIITQFDQFVAAGISSGSFIAGFQQLGFVLGVVWNGFKALLQIVGGIGAAASAAGIGDLLSPLQTIANIVTSGPFMNALTTLFSGAAAGAAGLLSALTPIGNLIATLAPILAGFLSGAGNTLGALFSSLANALNNPAFANGLDAFFGGILALIRPLIPLMPVFAEKLALIGTFAGNLLTVLGPVFASLLQAIVPVVSKIFTAVTPLINILGPLLSKAIGQVGPVLAGIITALTPFLTYIGQILPLVGQLVGVILSALGPALAQLGPIFSTLLQAAMPIITSIFQILTPLIGPLVSLLGILLGVALKPLTLAFQILGPVIQAIAPILTLLAQIVGAVVQTIVDLFTGNFSDIGKVWSGVWNSIVDFYNGSVKPVFEAIGNFFVGLWKGYIAGIQGFAKTITDIWNNLWNGVHDIFTTVWNAISGFEKGIFNGIMKGIQGFVNGAIDIINGLTAGLSSVTAVVGIKLGKIPHIGLPQLWQGATVLPRPGGTAVNIGERGRAESVVDTGKFNALMDIVLNSFPKALGAVRNGGTRGDSNPTGGTTNNNNTTMNNTFPLPLGPDPESVAQEFVNRAAEQIGFVG